MCANVLHSNYLCDECGCPESETHGAVAPVVNARGQVVGFFCPKCAPVAESLVRQINVLHGAHYDGTQCVAGPIGTPHYRSVGQARAYLAQHSSARARLSAC